MSAALLYIISILPSDIQDFAFAIFNELSALITSLGTRVDVPFNATNFAATGAMTWTLTAPDQATYSYVLNGKILTVFVQLNTTTVGGTVAGNNLTIKMPNGVLAAKTVAQCGLGAPGGAATEGIIVSVTTGSNLITLLRYAANWIAGADNTSVNFVATIPIQ
jgi:hypothetical protein